MDVAEFQTDFGGTALLPGEDGYDEARSVWNGDIDRHPAVIARCRDAGQVAAAIAFARAEGLEIAVRGGGHNFAGHGVCEGGVMIDLSQMTDITVDPAAKRVRCGGGTTWAQLDAATQEHALAVPGGVISHTGVAGLTLGGGIGWLVRKAGLSCDNLVSAQVVTADGRVVTASDDEHPDLLWGLRGGGGNFGVVTEFEFALHEVGPLVHVAINFWSLDRAGEALRFARDYQEQLPPNHTSQVVGLSAPPAPFVPEEHHFAPGFVLVVVGFGTAEEHAAAIAPIQATLPPTFEFITPMPYTALQQMLDESAPWGILGYEKALYLDDFPDAAMDVIVEAFPRRSSPLTIMPIFRLAGAYHDVADDASAWGGSRASKYVVNIAASAFDADSFTKDRAWVRALYDALLPYAAGAGSYVNFISEPDEDRVRASYGPEKYARLAALKAEYDPDNVFHLNANIRPALA